MLLEDNFRYELLKSDHSSALVYFHKLVAPRKPKAQGATMQVAMSRLAVGLISSWG